MRCEYDFCIYNFKNCCTVEEVEINAVGMCASIMLVDIPHEQLNESKEAQLTKYAGEDQ
jgi:hypothetical protein